MRYIERQMKTEGKRAVKAMTRNMEANRKALLDKYYSVQIKSEEPKKHKDMASRIYCEAAAVLLVVTIALISAVSLVSGLNLKRENIVYATGFIGENAYVVGVQMRKCKSQTGADGNLDEFSYDSEYKELPACYYEEVLNIIRDFNFTVDGSKTYMSTEPSDNPVVKESERDYLNAPCIFIDYVADGNEPDMFDSVRRMVISEHYITFEEYETVEEYYDRNAKKEYGIGMIGATHRYKDRTGTYKKLCGFIEENGVRDLFDNALLWRDGDEKIKVEIPLDEDVLELTYDGRFGEDKDYVVFWLETPLRTVWEVETEYGYDVDVVFAQMRRVKDGRPRTYFADMCNAYPRASYLFGDGTSRTERDAFPIVVSASEGVKRGKVATFRLRKVKVDVTYECVGKTEGRTIIYSFTPEVSGDYYIDFQEGSFRYILSMERYIELYNSYMDENNIGMYWWSLEPLYNAPDAKIDKYNIPLAAGTTYLIFANSNLEFCGNGSWLCNMGVGSGKPDTHRFILSYIG